jgi:transketolase
MFRTLRDCVVFYPADAMAAERLVEEAARHHGPVYIRTARNSTPILYAAEEAFRVGGCKVLRSGAEDRITIAAAGITLYEALEAHAVLQGAGIAARVIDLYSIQPLDIDTLRKAADETGRILTVEDHCPAGGIGEAVAAALADHPAPVYTLAVRKLPKSGSTEELLAYEEISKDAIVRKVQEVLGEARA